MLFIQALISAALVGGIAHSDPTPNSFQQDVDSAFKEIMQTHTGKAICQLVLGADPATIAFHLGVSDDAAATIAQGCVGELANDWIFATPNQQANSLPNKFAHGRTYRMVAADTDFPIESWTDSITNTTVLLVGRDGLSHEHMVQVMAHELGVYLDAKSNPASSDAKFIPDLRDMHIVRASDNPMDPLVAISDPLIGHTMTFIRALQVEYSIVDELIANHKIIPPADHDNPYLKHLISSDCQEECLEKAIVNIRQQAYLPISLPLLVFAPYFRKLINRDLTRLATWWNSDQKDLATNLLSNLPAKFLLTQFTGNPLLDLQRGFDTGSTDFDTATRFACEDLWPLEWPALTQAQVMDRHQLTLLEYMKKPLMSVYNIGLTSGPRVRIRTGSLE